MTPAQVFSCDIYEIFKNTFFAEYLEWLLLTVSQPVALLKKRFQQRCFSVNFAKFLRISFDRIATDASCVYLWFFSKFFRTPLLQNTSGKLLTSCTSWKSGIHFLRMHHDYFFWRDFESVRARFLSGNTSKK